MNHSSTPSAPGQILLIGPVPPPYGGWSHQVHQLSQIRPGEGLSWLPLNTRLHPDVGQFSSRFRIAVACAQQLALMNRLIRNHRCPGAMVLSGAGSSGYRDLVMAWVLARKKVPYALKLIGGNYQIFLPSKSRLFQRIAKSAFRSAQVVYCELDETTEALRRAQPGVVFRTLPNFVDLARLGGLAESIPKDNGFSVVYFGNMTPEKGVEIVLDATDRVCDAIHECRFHFVGGPIRQGYLDVFRERVRVKRHAEKITVHGRCDHDDMLRIAARSHVFAMPSFWPGEGLPAAALEAMGLGLVPVVTTWRGLGEAVIHEKNGLHVRQKSAEDLADAIVRLERDPRLRGELAAASRRRVKEHFDRRVVEAEIQQTIRQLLAARNTLK